MGYDRLSQSLVCASALVLLACGARHKAANAPAPSASSSAGGSAVQVERVPAEGTTNTDSSRLGLQVLVGPESQSVVFRDRRKLNLGKGGLRLSLRGVPQDIEPASVSLRTLTKGAELRLVDVRFYDGKVTPNNLLSPYLGKPVSAYLWDTPSAGEQKREAVLLGVAPEGPVVALDQQTRVLDFGRVAVPKLPDGLRAEPTLELLLTSDRDQQEVELTYSSKLVKAGMEYQLVQVPGTATAELTGVLGILNETGVPLVDAILQLSSDADQPTEFASSEAGAEPAATTAPSTTEVRLTEPVTVAAGERVILRLFGPTSTTLTRRVVLEGPGLPIYSSEGDWSVTQRAVLDAESVEKVPLSSTGMVGGRTHLFERDEANPPRTYGTAAARPLPGAQGIRVDLGLENKYPARRRLLGRRNLGRCVADTSWEVIVSNPTEAPLLLEDVEPVTGKYQLLDSSVPPRAKEVDHFVFGLTVPPSGEATLKFRVRTMGCVPARRHYWQPSWNQSWGKANKESS